MKARLMFGVEPYADLVATETGESHVGGDLSSSLPLQFQRISSSSSGRRSLVSADGSVSADGDPPPRTNQIRVRMKSIIAADIFISAPPYLISHFFAGFLEEFILSALFTYVHGVAQGSLGKGLKTCLRVR